MTGLLSQINAQVQGFENTAVGDIPTGWVKSQTESDDPGFVVGDVTGYAYDGTHYLVHEGVDLAAESTSWVVSEAFHLGVDYQLKFYWRGRWTSAYNFTGVYISTASNDPVANPGDFTLLKELSPANYPDTWLQWNEEQYDMRPYNNQTVYIAFKYIGDHAHDIFIDDIGIGPIPYCETPDNLAVTDRSTDSITLSWDNALGVDDYDIAWGIPGFDPNASGASIVTAVNTTTYEVTGLTMDTTYEFYVRSACSSFNHSDWIGPVTGITKGTPPANDECDAAISLTVNNGSVCTDTTHGTTMNATASAQPDDVVGTPNDDVWFSFVAAQDTHIVSLLNISAVLGASTDMGLAVYSGDCNTLSLIGDSDNNKYKAENLTPGDTYYVRVYSLGDTSVDAQEFDVCVAVPPANDDCDNAITLDVYDAFASGGHEVDGNTSFASDSGNHPTCDDFGTNLDLWYSFTVPAGETGVVVLTGGAEGSRIEAALYDSCGGIEMDCQGQSGSKTFNGLTAGQTYILQVWHDDFNAGPFNIAIEKMPPAPSNDECNDAIDLTVYDAGASAGHEVTASTVSATDSNMHPSCDDTGTNLDLWYSFTVPAGETGVIVKTGGPDGANIEAALYDSCGGTEIDCQNNSSSKIFSGLSGGQTYILQVWHDDFNAGTFSIAVEKLPPPPANDTCDNAMALTVFNSCQPVTVSNFNSTDSGVPDPGCANYSGGDLWFTATVPSSGSLTVETTRVSGGITDTGMAVYSGDCNNLTLIECDDDDSTDGFFSMIELSGRTAGETIYIRVWEYGNNSFGDFGVCVHDSSVSLEENTIAGLKLYPNPVTNTLNIKAQNDIQNISVYNISGQKVISLNPHNTNLQVDMSHLTNGVYFVKIQSNDQLTAVKVVKK